MNSNHPCANPSSRYSINETCALLGVHRDSLHKYTHKTREIECGHRIIGGKPRKFYLGSEINRFWESKTTIDLST